MDAPAAAAGVDAVRSSVVSYPQKEEQERLEEYRDQLKKELAGVEERIQELKGK